MEEEKGTLTRKVFMLSVFLSLTSASLFIAGFIEDVREWDPTSGVLFWLLGTLSGLPGFYVICKLIHAW